MFDKLQFVDREEKLEVLFARPEMDQQPMPRQTQPTTISAALVSTLSSSADDRAKEKTRLNRALKDHSISGVGFGSEFAKRLERISELQYH